jgi:murein L,D-transpeptidase YafK
LSTGPAYIKLVFFNGKGRQRRDMAPRIPRGIRIACAAAALAVAGCQETERSLNGLFPKADAPVPAELAKTMQTKGMAAAAPVFLRIFKEESKLEVWKEAANGRYDLLSTYDICKWSGVLGPKIKEGDRQAPEGFYTVNPYQMNPKSDYYLSFNMGFPNAFDRAHGRTGTHLMVHGACSSAGCYSMTDENVAEIYALARDAFKGGQRNFQIQAFPFRMTPENMARHRGDPNIEFWRMLKEGSDHFEITRVPPKVDVCEKRYVFNRIAADDKPFKADQPCPQTTQPDTLALAYAAKQAKDGKAYQEEIRKLAFKEMFANRTPPDIDNAAQGSLAAARGADTADAARAAESQARAEGGIPVPEPAPRIEETPPPPKKRGLLALFGVKG